MLFKSPSLWYFCYSSPNGLCQKEIQFYAKCAGKSLVSHQLDSCSHFKEIIFDDCTENGSQRKSGSKENREKALAVLKAGGGGGLFKRTGGVQMERGRWICFLFQRFDRDDLLMNWM